jgi:predicted patatin/cPLA2 family phospholipase
VTATPEPPWPWLSGDREVLDVLRQRRAAGSVPRSRDDPHRVALVIEGGGMRGAYLAGMARALGQLGLRDTFDEIFAVSAGAFTAAALLVGREERCVAVYAEDLAHGGFVSWRRFLTGRGPLIDLDFLIDEVISRRQRIRFADLSTAGPVLRPVATDVDALAPVTLDGLHGDDDWRAALRATATVPLVGGDPVPFRGRRYLDGFVADPLPLARAIRSGATHVLTLVARAPGERLRPSRRHPPLARSRYDAVAPGLAALMAERSTSYTASLAIIDDRGHRNRGDARVLAVRPTVATGVSAVTTDPARLWRAGAAGEDAMRIAVTAAGTGR